MDFNGIYPLVNMQKAIENGLYSVIYPLKMDEHGDFPVEPKKKGG